MSTSTWQPATAVSPQNIDWQSWLKIAEEHNLEESIKGLSREQVNTLQPLMKQSRDFWQQQCENFSPEEMKSLLFFFTLAENFHSELSAGNDSPVIGIYKVLKKIKPLTKDELLWIKSNSQNQFLPHGSIF